MLGAALARRYGSPKSLEFGHPDALAHQADGIRQPRAGHPPGDQAHPMAGSLPDPDHIARSGGHRPSLPRRLPIAYAERTARIKMLRGVMGLSQNSPTSTA